MTALDRLAPAIYVAVGVVMGALAVMWGWQ